MTDREAMLALAAGIPDGDDPDWQQQHDRYNAALAHANTEPNELEPAFTVHVTLDGDDWPPTQTENAQAALVAALDGMVTVRLIRGYTIEVSP